MLVQVGLCRTCTETTLLAFSRTGSFIFSAVTTISPTDPATNYSIPTPTNTDVHFNGHWLVVIGIGIGIVAVVVVIVIIVCCVKCRKLQNQGSDARSTNIAHKTRSVFEHSHEKTNNLSFRPGPTQTGLYSHRSRLEA